MNKEEFDTFVILTYGTNLSKRDAIDRLPPSVLGKAVSMVLNGAIPTDAVYQALKEYHEQE